jgi:alkanesulfonate monooxygenase SsuD/methylene tetrahydromethanopterin reductase-like flavin-dependent oxidoreductase (luciferase family)
VIKPWVFEFFPAPREPGATTDPQRSADYFNWYLDLWPRAELLGYEGIFFSEHHFGPAYSPAPNLLIAQVALKTGRSDWASWASCCLITSLGRSSRKSACSTI